VSTANPLADLLAGLAAAFAALGRRWYLFGAQAVVVWGKPRASADVDVTVEAAPEDSAELVQALATAGFELRLTRGVEEFVARARVLPFLHPGSGIPVDVVLAGPGLEERFLDGAVPVDIGGVSVPVLSAEDLVVTKILAGRPKDLEDVRGVLAERIDALDLAAIRSTLGELEAALGQSDLLPLFEAEAERARG
jgi:hypothetical protein